MVKRDLLAAAAIVQAVPEKKEKALRVPASGRMPELDALRGLMLVWMTLTHLPTRASVYSNQTLGFISAAEGFIFLSAFLTGRIFTRKLHESGFRFVAHKLVARVLRLYGYHVSLLAVAFVVVARVAIKTAQPSLLGLVDFYIAHPLRSVVASILLIYKPPLLDILPMYILFLLVTPLVLLGGYRYGWKLILVPSFLLWVIAQFGFRAAFYNFTLQALHIGIPLSALGAFDLFAWQFLWMVGLAVGSGALTPSQNIYRAWPLATIVLGVFFVVRHTGAWDVMNNAPWVPLTDKWHLGALRLLNFGCAALLFSYFRPVLSRYLAVGPLLTLGKASLEVFCAHLLICFEALALVGDGNGLTAAPQIAIVGSSLVALYLVARAFGSANAT